MITEEQLKKAYQQEAEYWEEIQKHNRKIFQDINAPEDEIEELLIDCTVTGKIEFVPIPRGDNQKEEYKFFKSIYVDQYSRGMEGDSFAGYIYARYAKDKWLKIPYEC